MEQKRHELIEQLHVISTYPMRIARRDAYIDVIVNPNRESDRQISTSATKTHPETLRALFIKLIVVSREFLSPGPALWTSLVRLLFLRSTTRARVTSK